MRISNRILTVACLLLPLVLVRCTETRITKEVKSVPPPSAVSQLSPAAAKRRDIGFTSRAKLLEHYQKHGREFGTITVEEYLRRAQELRDAPVGGDVLEIVRADHVITRFQRSTGSFLAFNRDKTIRTYFKPNTGETYFRRQGQRGD
jgi:pyocin large subunit-like protein